MKKNTRKTPISKKINIIIILIILLLFVTIGIPSFCMLLTKDNSDKIDYWDGTISSNYQSGTGSQEDPYIISNAKEFAYFQEQINNGETYQETYFKFTDNIHLNNGVIEYKKDKIIYTKDSVKYYIKPFTNEYYSDLEYTKKEGTIYKFPSIDTFEGYIDGNDKFIYGLYLTDENQEELALFENFYGQINNLYFSNALIYGNYSVGLISETQNAGYNNLIFNGYIHTNGLDITKTYNLDDIEITDSITTTNINIEHIPINSELKNTILKGTFDGERITINNQTITSNEFELTFENIIDNILIETDSVNSTITNLTYEINYNSNVSSLINKANNVKINNSFIKGTIDGNNITTSLLGIINGENEINNTYTDTYINGKYISSGLIGIVDNANLIINNVYNAGEIKSDNYTGGIIGITSSNSTINISNTFNTGNLIGKNIGAFISENNVEIEYTNNYYTNENIKPIANSNQEIASYIEKENLFKRDFLINDLNFLETIWDIEEGTLPKLISFDNESPIVHIELLDYTWTDINENTIKINQTAPININYTDKHSDILKVEYHIGNKIYTKEEINNIDFDLYEEKIILDNNGDYYIIFKVTDVIGNITITSTPLINIEGYNLNVTDIYNNSLEKYNNQISTNSQIKYNFQRTYKMNTFKYNEETIYMIETDNQLPDKTIIKFIDNIYDKVYSYKVDNNNNDTLNNKFLYKISNFQELGYEEEKLFERKVIDYYKDNLLSENFDIIFNFENTNINQNQEFSINLVAIHENNIYTSSFTNLNNQFIIAKYDSDNNEINNKIILSTDFNEYIDMSKIGNYTINLTNEITNSKLNNKDIYNEEFNTDKLYLLINILDSNNKLVKGNLINNLSINYNENTYFSNNYGYIKIPLTNNNINLKLNINYLIKDINNGIYYLKIASCNSSSVCSEEQIIPINISNTTSNIDCKFIVNIEDKDRLLLKNKAQTLNNKSSININFDYEGNLVDPNIRIKLYKKMNFDTHNQVYELIDISQYINNHLEKSRDYEYYISKNIDNNFDINLDLKINNFQYSGYKLLFELYDGDSFIKEDSKTIIVK